VDDCKDAERAVKILTVLLNKVTAKMQKREEEKATTNITQINALISSTPTKPTVDSLRHSPYFTDQFGLCAQLTVEHQQHSADDTLMRDDLLDTIGSDLTVPADFNWVSSLISILLSNFYFSMSYFF